MRLLVFPFLLLGFATPAVPRQEQPRPLVILVHGRGQLGSDSAAMRREWKNELDGALGAQGFPKLRDEEVALAWYADVVDPGAVAACDQPRRPDEAGIAEFARGFLVSLASVMPDSGRASDLQARSLLGDALYVMDPSTRCAAETRFGNLVKKARAAGRPVIVVAYSLGAVVAYEWLDRASDSSAVQLITLGSPLGVPVAREILTGNMGALRIPQSVSRWVNIYDADDAFAAPLGLGATRALDRVAKSDRDYDPHRVNRYLRDAETGSALGAALCAAAGDAWSPKCAGLRSP
ncbi:MAG TPA: hypothetical protein VFO66_13275 [Gemmatimonadaceae bacterium]|nr:hypothetical protein [Gemmatimonadaceae bacterium]